MFYNENIPYPRTKTHENGSLCSDDEKVVAYITKAEKRPLGLESDVDSTLAILVNNSTSTTTENDKSCKLMVSLVFQMALTRTSTDPLHKRSSTILFSDF